MRIGINASFLEKPMTGIGQVTTNFLRELASLSVKEDILNSPERVVYLYCQEAPVLDFELPKNFIVKVFLPWYRRNDVIRQWLWEKQLANEATKDGCEVFFSLYQSATVFSSKGIRHVMLVHDIIPKLFPGYLKKWSHYWHYRAIVLGMQKAAALITPSETSKQDIIRELSISPQNIQVVPLGVNAQFFESFTDETIRKNLKRYQLDPGYLYHGGGLEVRKNTEAVLRGYAMALARKGDLPPLVISGKVYAETNPLATPVNKLLEELGLSQKVRLLGVVPQDDLPFLYQGAKLFLFPSQYEGFGLPVLEAFASKVPVITTSAGALAELAHPTSALVVATDQHLTDNIAHALETLLGNEEKCRELSQKAYQRSQIYSWKEFTEKVWHFLLQ